MRATLAIAVAALVAGASARASAACPTADALCTGDPCLMSGATIDTPCDVDFGTRTLVIGFGNVVLGGGPATLRAGSIHVGGGLSGRGRTGAQVTLVSAGEVRQDGLIDVSGTAAAGSITINAGGDVTLSGKLKASGGTTAPGGSIIVEAGGTVLGPMTFSDDVHGARTAAAGSAIYRGAAGVNLIGHLFLRSGFGGYAEFTSSGGPVSIGTDIRTRNTAGIGATLVLQAATDATVARGMSADGRIDGGVIRVSGATVTMPQHQGLHARGRSGAGGSVTVVGGTVHADEALGVDGATAGGVLDVRGDTIAITRGVTASGKTAGGRITIAATGDVALAPSAAAIGGGGTIGVRAGGNLTAQGTIRVAPAGCIGLNAGGVLDVSGAVLDATAVASCP